MNLIKNVYAHCDVPCGIYETDTAKVAAKTALKMCQIMNELENTSNIQIQHTLVRSTMIKEEHIRKLKESLHGLWTDYFKPEHLDIIPDLHSIMWNTLKQATKVKQQSSVSEAQKLVEMVDKVDQIFVLSKQ